MSFVEFLGVNDDSDLDPLGLGSRVQSGFGSRAVFGQQVADTTKKIDAYNNPLTSLRSFYQQMYEGVNWGVVQNAPPIVANRIRANRSPVPNTRGRVDVSGGVSLQCNTRSMLPFFKHATMSSGNGTAGENVTKAFTSANIVAATNMTQVASTTTYRYFTGADVEVLYTDAVNTALGGGDNGYSTNKASPPTKLQVTLTGLTHSSSTSVTLRGVDQNGIILEETYAIAAATDLEFVTENHYSNLLVGTSSNGRWAIEVRGASASDTPNIKIDAYNPTKMKNERRSLYEIESAIQGPMTVYIIKGGNPHTTGQNGGIPNVYAGCFVNSLTLNVSETVMLDMDFIGRNGYARVTPATIDQYGQNWGRNVVPPDSYTGGSASANPRTDWSFASPVNPVMTGWESGLQIKEPGQNSWVTVPCTDFSLNLNNNLTHNERYWLRRYHTEPTPSGALDCMVNGTIDYRTAQGYDFLQQENITMEARMICMSRDVGGPENYIIAHFGEVVLNETVDPPVSGEDVITQSFSLKATSKNSGATFSDTRTYKDTLAKMIERSPVVFEIASDQVLDDLIN